MNTFLIILAMLAVLFGAFLMMRVRIRLELAGEERRLFFGLGRSGPEFDFRAGRGRVKLFGLSVRSFPLRRASAPQVLETTKPATNAEKTAPRRKRRRSWSDLLALLPRLGRATWELFTGLLADLIVEEAEGRIEGGFDRPDLTGQVYGYYHAALAVVPGLAGRFSYVPVWTEASFDGSVRLAVAWPVYRLLYRTGKWMIKINVLKLIRMTIGTKEGGRDVQ